MGDSLRRSGMIAGNHHGLDAGAFAFGDRFANLSARRVLQANQSKQCQPLFDFGFND